MEWDLAVNTAESSKPLGNRASAGPVLGLMPFNTFISDLEENA